MKILYEIASRTRQRVSEQKKLCPLLRVKELALLKMKEDTFDTIEHNPFYRALATPSLSFICEVKKASPSKGVIAQDFPYLEIAREYEKAGASAISVLTEPYYFQGSNQYLKEIARNVSLPILRKDFVVDEYQIYEAKILGASAILLILSILTKEQVVRYYQLATSLGLAVLMEAHTAEEVKLAVESGARVIGVNNRDLNTFQVDITTSITLRSLVPDSILFVSESGIKTKEDIKALYDNHVDGVLIGETMMRSRNKKELIAQFKRKPKIKICGIRRKEDVSYCNEYLPDYAGFVFATSKRQVSFTEAEQLSKLFDKRITLVGVFVNEAIENIVSLLKRGVIQHVQLHGTEDSKYIQDLRKEVETIPNVAIIKAIRVKNQEDIIQANKIEADYLLFDTYTKDCEGGSGIAFNWELLRHVIRPYFLAGGIQASNVTQAIEVAAPYAIDVSSGVETNGCKDKEKIRTIIKRLRD